MKEVIIFKTKSTVPLFTDTKDTKEWIDKISVHITPFKVHGSKHYYKGFGYKEGRPYNNSLDTEVSKFIFQDIIGITYVPEKAIEYNNAVQEFYSTLVIEIPNEGLKLQIGLKDDTKEIDVDNPPLKPLDYIIYKSVFENNPMLVAKNKDEGEAIPYMVCYMFDATNAERIKRENTESLSVSIANYDKIKENSKLVKTFISLISELKSTGNNDTNRVILFEWVSKNPYRFKELFKIYEQEGDSFSNRLLLNSFVREGLIIKKGDGSYFDSVSSTKLADDLTEMLYYLKEPNNEESLKGYITSLTKILTERGLN